MARQRRIAVANYPHHIMQRGHNGRDVFVTKGDRESYLATLVEFRTQLGFKVYAYCLMTNHVHLLIDPGDDAANLSLLMKHLAGRHTRRLNRRQRRSGTAWGGRFKCSPIETDRYLLACSRYIELNPVRAGMVGDPEEYPWSSYRARMGLSECDWLDPDPCFLALAPTTQRRRRRYREFMEHGSSQAELGFIRGALQRNQLTGSESFIVKVEQITGERILPRARGRPRR
jgi:putative transposase